MSYIIDKQYSGSMFLENELMYHDFERCTFDDCDFTACDFTGLAFIDCVFTGCEFAHAKINYVSFRDVQFTHCDFSSVNFAMVDSLLFKFGFKDCTLDYAKFYTLKLKNTLFENCSIVAADFMEADITGVVFNNCNLHKSVFMDTIANKTDFSTSYNFTIDPEKNKLKKAVFSQTGLAGLLTKYELIVK
ncbi:MAG: pentapeptide repeat-containing protein [Bacteroidota bacterium]